MNLVEEVYRFTKRLPKEETYGLRDQVRRSSVSIALNIAEGSGAKGDNELIRYLYLAKKSLFETVTALRLTQRLYNLKPKNLLKNYDRLGRSLQALINSLSEKEAKD